IKRFLGVKSQFILSGNIYDIYPISIKEMVTVGTLEIYLKNILSEAGYRYFFRYEPYAVTSLLAPPTTTGPEGQPQNEAVALDIPHASSIVTLERLSTFIQSISCFPEGAAILLGFGSRIQRLCQNEFDKFLYDLFRVSLNSKARGGRHNLVFWALDKDNDLPPWYANSRIMLLPIPKPDHDIRRHIIMAAGKAISGYQDILTHDPLRHATLVNRFVDQTGGLYASELVSISSLAAQDGLNFSQIGDAVRHYKLGVPDNPWDKLDRGIILAGYDRLSSRVVGQNRAVNHSLDIIKRSIFDLSGSQFSPYAQKPKGVLFFAGPTGVGKTELAKSITELIFGSPENYIRFDMSEFNQPHADQRLLGAPPGYLGYDVGGELTNSIKQKPFTLILFDEIEKANPKIMDIFLQILDDGRLTSGRGETVYFSDAIIVFTSNLGVYQDTPEGGKEALVNPAMSYDEVRKKINEAIYNFFTFTLHRPEILNRIGKNVVVFDFIREKEAFQIYEKMLGNVLTRLMDVHKVTLTLAPKDRELLGKVVTQDLSMGGRGIGNSLEQFFVNPLARELFALGVQSHRNIMCSFTEKSDGNFSLTLKSAS
ncbi:MAG: AAA family ATPase, partial [Deltaproteobacteria bacterium]|nr:AAA family ATPase [Deltaproteobacteria bacterium]